MPIDFSELYTQFHLSITGQDCGDFCAPHNERGVPFCCDLGHAIPTAYQAEWQYLESNTDLWRLWQPDEPSRAAADLRSQTPQGQVLIACKGHRFCQRAYRSITCRAFPFFPYITLEGEFIGLAYYWQYEDRCWVISHLSAVTPEFRAQFIAAYDRLLLEMPGELENFRYHSIVMRRVFGRRGQAIPVLHRNGNAYRLTPKNGRLRRFRTESFPKFGVYRIAAGLPFPDEIGQE